MDSKFDEPNLSAVLDAYRDECAKSGINEHPDFWHEFLTGVGLRHYSLSRLIVNNKKKWLLAKIKYGI